MQFLAPDHGASQPPSGRGRIATAHSRSAQQVLLESESDHVPTSRTIQSPFQPPPWWFQRAPSTQRKESQGFNLYHSKVLCHGNSGTPDSSSASKGGGVVLGVGQRANTSPQLPTPPACVVLCGGRTGVSM